MKTVKEVSKLAGVSVRALHHYDAIGLLKPTAVTEAGYRLYDDRALRRLQTILLFRELQFPLKEIKAILDSPDFDPSKAIAQQIKLLELQYKHIGELIAFARGIQNKGGTKMDFAVFDRSEMEAYASEVKAKWGSTKAYQEYRQKDIAQHNDHYGKTAHALMTMFSELGELKHLSPHAGEVQEKIAALQQWITDHCYTCTNELLSGLGELYVCDERFRRNIDKAGGEGTAEFVRQAIKAYCSNG